MGIPKQDILLCSLEIALELWVPLPLPQGSCKGLWRCTLRLHRLFPPYKVKVCL